MPALSLSLTPKKDGYTVRLASKFDDFDHIVLKDFKTLQEAEEKRESMIDNSEGRILEHRLVLI